MVSNLDLWFKSRSHFSMSIVYVYNRSPRSTNLTLTRQPRQSFDVPLSEADPVFRIHRRKRDNDNSYISQNQISQLEPIGYSTPRKPVLDTNSQHKRRRNTICCYSCHCLADPFPSNKDVPTWPINIPFGSFLSGDASRHNNSPSTSTRIKTATPYDPPSPPSSLLGQPRITSFVNFSDSSDDCVTPKKVRNKTKSSRYLPSRGKEKRNSAPPSVNLHKNRVVDAKPTNEPLHTGQSYPKLLHKDLRQIPHANSVSSYTLKQFEIGLSPIIEDTHIFSNTLRGPRGVAMNPATTDSSESSYGELITNKTIDYLITTEYETCGRVEWESQERNQQPESSVRFDTHNYTDFRGDRYWNDEFWEIFEDSSLIPELTLTAPTPEIGISTKFHSVVLPSELSCNDDLGCQRPGDNFVTSETADPFRPNRLGYTTTLSSISKVLGAGADMLLGVGNGVFDDMPDAGVVGNSTVQLPAHSGDHLGGNWPGSQSLGSDQARTGFLGQLLRRRSTGNSKLSERSGRVWERVSRILGSSRRSSRSARDQENSTVATLAGHLEKSCVAKAPPHMARGWKRFSHILADVVVPSRRRSAGDQAQLTFTELADPLERSSAFSGSGCTRRHGLDIASDNAKHVDERWYGPSSTGTATSACINEKHVATHLDKLVVTSKDIGTSRNWNFFGADVTTSHDQPRRHSFGPGMNRRRQSPAEDPG